MDAVLTIDTRDDQATDRDVVDVVRDATLACIARFGLTKTTLDDIAREAGVSRATVYRAFPGGRDVLVRSVVQSEIDRFFACVGGAIAGIDDLEDLLTVGVGTSMRLLRDHAPLRNVVQMEPGVVLPQFAFHRLDLVLSYAAEFAAPYLLRHVGTPHDARSAAEHVARIVLSYTMHPDPAIDPSDDASIRRLVRRHILPGLTAGPITETKGKS